MIGPDVTAPTVTVVVLVAAAVCGAGVVARDRLAPVRRHSRTVDSVRSPRVPVGTVALAAVTAGAALVAGPLAGVVVLGGLGAAAAIRPTVRARRRRRATEQALPDTIDLLVHGIRAGLTPRHGVEYLATRGPAATRPAFADVVHRTERGASFADALGALPDRLGPAAGPIADTIATCERAGLPLTPALDQLTRDARDARRRLDQADARRLPVRLAFPLVVCTLPSFVLLAIAPAVIAALSSLGSSTW